MTNSSWDTPEAVELIFALLAGKYSQENDILICCR